MFESLDHSRQVVEAVQALPEIYRSAVYLRFYEGRSVARIATDLGLSRDTVKTRVRRALEKLRADLDARSGGDRRQWMAALLPLAGAPPLAVGTGLTPATSVARLAPATPAGSTVSAGSLIGGVLIMKKLVLALVVGVLLFAGFYSVGVFDPAETPAGEPVAGLDAPPAPVDGETGDGGLVAVPTESETARALASPPTPDDHAGSPATTGTLLVEVSWESDGSPAADVGLIAYPGGDVDRNRDARRVTTDGYGMVVLEELPPGPVSLRGFRGGQSDGRITAGGQATARLVIPRGFDIEGVVVDPEGRPVPGAWVWIGRPGLGWLAGRHATTADEHGCFSLRSVARDRTIGARAMGFGPAIAEELETRKVRPGEALLLELRLRGEGGTVAGRVLDPEGDPVEGARVVVGNPARYGTREDGSLGPASPSPSLVTDEEGRFAVDGVGAGLNEVYALADGFPLQIRIVDVYQEGMVDPVELTLVAPVTLTGTVLDPRGRLLVEPLVDARPLRRFSTGDLAFLCVGVAGVQGTA